MANVIEKSECSCQRCQAYCKHVPGWFRPGEAEKAAALLGLTLPDFFARHLVADFWVEADGLPTTFVLRPASVSDESGSEAPSNPLGACSFYKDGACAIHTAKPHDCAMANHKNENEHGAMMADRHATVRLWTEHHGQVRDLLGRQPEMPQPDLGDVFSMMFGGLLGYDEDDAMDESLHVERDEREG